jgi:cytochrome c
MGAKFVQIKPKWYAITLFSKGDFNFVVKGGPWIHLGNALLIKPLEAAERLSKIDLTVVPIWVHMYDVPWDKQTMANGNNGGSILGKVVEVEVVASGTKFKYSMCVWIGIPINKML